MKKILMIFTFISIYTLSVTSNSRNVADYIFSQTTGTFTSIHTTGTYITGGCTSSVFGNLPIGFTFTYNGNSYSQFGLCCSGWISLGPGTPGTSIYPISTGSTNNVIAPFSAQLTSNVAGDGIYYKTEGTSPNRVLTVEWWQYGFWLNGFDEICFQIKLYETTNEIRFVYTTNDELSIRNIQVGLRGSSNSDFINRQTTTNWSQTTAGTANTAYCLFSPGITPPAGLTFIFTPNPVGIVNNNNQNPANFLLEQNYPNPFNPTTNIGFRIAGFGLVTLKIFDITGREIATIINEELRAGGYKTDWNASVYSRGLYVYNLTVKKSKEVFSETRKMVLVK